MYYWKGYVTEDANGPFASSCYQNEYFILNSLFFINFFYLVIIIYLLTIQLINNAKKIKININKKIKAKLFKINPIIGKVSFDMKN
jgi:hypothetical protein